MNNLFFFMECGTFRQSRLWKYMFRLHEIY